MTATIRILSDNSIASTAVTVEGPRPTLWMEVGERKALTLDVRDLLSADETVTAVAASNVTATNEAGKIILDVTSPTSMKEITVTITTSSGRVHVFKMHAKRKRCERAMDYSGWAA